MIPLRQRTRKKSDPGDAPEPSRPEDRIDVRTDHPGIAATISICGAASNAGKTWICESVLRGLRDEGARTLALKVTRTHLGDCPRGIATCGTCDSLAGDFELVGDLSLLDVLGKDTGRYVAAGADRVLWLLVRPSAVRRGLMAALSEVPPGFVVVAEGNSFRDYASADVALMALSGDGAIKPSAQHVLDRIDAFVQHRRPAPGARGRQLPRLIAAGDAWGFVRGRIAPLLHPHRAFRR